MKSIIILLAAVVLVISGITGHILLEHRDTTTALCALRHDFEERKETTEEFLKNNPKGSGEITPGILKQSLRNYERTIKALEILECEEPH